MLKWLLLCVWRLVNQKDGNPLKLYINQTLYGLGHCSLPTNVLILTHLKRWKGVSAKPVCMEFCGFNKSDVESFF